jgi:sortase A
MLHLLKGLCLFSLGAGIFVLVQAMMPIISYQIWEMTTYRFQYGLTAPVSASTGGWGSDVLGVSVAQAGENLTEFGPQHTRDTPAPYDTFNLTIPKIDIYGAMVKVDSEDPQKNLVLLPGMALPGERGNMFIAGHSNFFRLGGEPNYYLSIFKNLMKMEKGDKIVATAQGQDFTYRVIGMKVVDPSETSVLLPPDATGRYISLMTCVPPGTFFKRLIVLGKLE